MMVSSNPMPNFVVLVLAITVVFTIGLSENLQLADGLSQVGNRLLYNLEVGESQVLQWGIRNTADEQREIQFYATGTGSELMHFEEFAVMEPKELRFFDFIVVVPADHKDNVEYHIELNALDRGTPLAEGETGIQVMMQMQQNPRIYIGENPVYTYEAPPQVEIREEEVIVRSTEVIDDGPKGETLEEKLARIAAANVKEETIDVESETQMEEIEVDVEPGYIPEPVVMDAEPAADNGGGCLIATATFGSELAPQVQQLREIRDNKLLSTGSGISFMTGFNQLYYSFSPTIADLERENPMFKELVKLAITPMISTLSIMNLAESEVEVLGYGISLIILNIGMYAGLPAFAIIRLYKRL